MLLSNENSFNNILENACKVLNIQGRGFVEVIYASKAKMQQLNLQALGKDKPTDVLSFPLLELDAHAPTNLVKSAYPFEYIKKLDAVNLGSIAICKAVARAQANQSGHSLEFEMQTLFTHGLLHLLGYDHAAERDYEDMIALQVQIMLL